MAKRRNPDEEEGGNPLVIVGIVVVVGIVGYFLFFKKPKGPTPEQLRQMALARQQPQQPVGTGVGAQLAQVFGPVAQAAAQMYGSHTSAQVQMAQIQAQGY